MTGKLELRRALGRTHYLRQMSLSDSSVNVFLVCLTFDLELLQLTEPYSALPCRRCHISAANFVKIRRSRAVATGPAAAGPMFGRIHKFSTLFDRSVKPRTMQSAWKTSKQEYREQLQYLCDLYQEIDASQLDVQQSLKGQFSQSDECSIKACIAFLQELSLPTRTYFSGVVKVVQLILVMPATNAVSERSLSTMRRIKSYPRSTMRQDRLNHLITLHAHLSR